MHIQVGDSWLHIFYIIQVLISRYLKRRYIYFILCVPFEASTALPGEWVIRLTDRIQLRMCSSRISSLELSNVAWLGWRFLGETTKIGQCWFWELKLCFYLFGGDWSEKRVSQPNEVLPETLWMYLVVLVWCWGIFATCGTWMEVYSKQRIAGRRVCKHHSLLHQPLWT